MLFSESVKPVLLYEFEKSLPKQILNQFIEKRKRRDMFAKRRGERTHKKGWKYQNTHPSRRVVKRKLKAKIQKELFLEAAFREEKVYEISNKKKPFIKRLREIVAQPQFELRPGLNVVIN